MKCSFLIISKIKSFNNDNDPESTQSKDKKHRKKREVFKYGLNDM
jgi:hypothetical protein